MNRDSSISEVRADIHFTLLHVAAVYNSTSCVRVLLRFAPHLVDAVNVYNATPLMYAVRYDSRDAAKVLLRAGADVRKEDNNGRTVFDFARMFNYEEMLELLEQHQQVSGTF